MRRKRLPKTAKRALYGNRAFCDPPPGSDFIRSSKPWERLSIDIVGPKPMTRNKNQYLLTVVDEFIRFPFAFRLRNITSSSVIKCLSTLFAIFGTPGFIHSDRGTQFVSSEFQKLLPPKWSCDLQNYALPHPGQWPKRALQRNCVESSSVPATLHKPPIN